jgi:LCP family protein required for cell wall assembly
MSTDSKSNISTKKKIFRTLLVFFVIFLLGGGFFVYKTGYILNKISESENSAFGSIFGALPVIGSRQEIKQDDQGRTNVLLLGMRGENMPGGGLLADTIMVATLKPGETESGADDKVGLISIPRDLYVQIPGTSQHSKINSVYYYGEEQQNTTGIKEMKEVVSEVTSLDIHYAAVINFKGFEELVDAVGGIEIELEESFIEPIQFHEMKVCDGDNGGVFTVDAGEFEHKIDERGKIVESYPLCYNSNEECGGVFSLPAGKQVLDGENALCYVRSRVTSSDFDRAKRQQLLLKELKEKLISLDTFTDFSKMNNILNAVGDNAKTDMSSTEMRKFFDKYSGMQNAEIYQRVLESSDEGFLTSPTDYPKEVGYILIPTVGQDNYSDIHNMAQNIFTLPEQTDINPVK